jgi:hypothetical protein
VNAALQLLLLLLSQARHLLLLLMLLLGVCFQHLLGYPDPYRLRHQHLLCRQIGSLTAAAPTAALQGMPYERQMGLAFPVWRTLLLLLLNVVGAASLQLRQ